MDAKLVVARPFDVGAQLRDERDHGLDVADPRHVVQDTGSLVSRQAARIGSAPFLFPAAVTRPLSGWPALDHERLCDVLR